METSIEKGSGRLVPGAGIEPAQPLGPRDFKSLASTYSATRANQFLRSDFVNWILEIEPYFKQKDWCLGFMGLKVQGSELIKLITNNRSPPNRFSNQVGNNLESAENVTSEP